MRRAGQTSRAQTASRYAKVIEASKRGRWAIDKDVTRGRDIELTQSSETVGSRKDDARIKGGHMFMLEYRAISWWYWLLTVGLLTAGVSGWSTGFLLAVGLTMFQLIHFSIREGSISSFPLQVRLGYLLLLLIALPDQFQVIYWLPMIGTWAQVLFGYCIMARTLSLLPCNRKEAFSFDLLRRTFFSAPIRGNIMQGLPPI